MSVDNDDDDDQSLVKYIQKERERDPDFKKLLPTTNDGKKIITHEQLLKIVENDLKYLKKKNIRFKQMWIYDEGKQYKVQPDIEE